MGPAVFVSSTFVDLRHVREGVSNFVAGMGYEPRLFEKGGVGFDWNAAIDESCYESVKESDMLVLIIGGRYGSPATEEMNKKAKKYTSVTKKEYITARDLNKPVFIFVDSSVLGEYKTFNANRGNQDIRYASVDNRLIFDLLDDIYSQKTNNYVAAFSRVEDITSTLRSQWASMLSQHIKERSRLIKRNMAKINCFKLLYFRKKAGITTAEVARAVEVNEKLIKSFEKVSIYRPGFDGYHDKYFPECEYQLIAKIEGVLDCKGKLAAGQYDDFRASYVSLYVDHSPDRARAKSGIYPFIPVSTKAVVFDFDGTLVRHLDGLTTWEMIWDELGYSINECAELHSLFRAGKLSHREWCQLTLEKFQLKRLTQQQFFSLSSRMQLVRGFKRVVTDLKSRGIKLYIVSGSIESMIRNIVGPEAKHFDQIMANDMVFDVTGEISAINGTRFDFQGKADFVRGVVETLKCAPLDVLFVGNAGNDAWAANAGVRTLCVNPTSTDPDDPDKWTANIRKMIDLKEILPFVK